MLPFFSFFLFISVPFFFRALGFEWVFAIGKTNFDVGGSVTRRDKKAIFTT